MKSSDWWAKEKECKDSEGNRERSSEKLGEAGPLDSTLEVLDSMAVNEGVRERATTEGLRDGAAEPQMVGFRDGG